MNIFEITDTQLLFKNRPIARLLPIALGFRRDLEDAILDYTTADDFEAEHAEALEAEYDDGFLAGREDAEQDAKNALQDQQAALEAKGFADGHAQGIKDAGLAADAARVQILLLALQEMHDLMQPLWLGVQEPNQYRRRTAKVSETKRAAQSACAAAHRALNAYRSE